MLAWSDRETEYIHRSQLRAGIANRLARYRWSSYNAYGYVLIHYSKGGSLF